MKNIAMPARNGHARKKSRYPGIATYSRAVTSTTTRDVSIPFLQTKRAARRPPLYQTRLFTARGVLRREQERERCVREVHERRRNELTTQKNRAALSRLRLGRDNRPRPSGTRLAGCRHRGAFAAGRHRILIRRTDRWNALEQRDDLITRQGLILQEAARQHVQVALAVGQYLLGPHITFVNDAMNFSIDLLRRGLGDILGARDAVPQ